MGWQGKISTSSSGALTITLPGAATSAAVTAFSSSLVFSAALLLATLDGASGIEEIHLTYGAYLVQRVPTFCAGNKYVH